MAPSTMRAVMAALVLIFWIGMSHACSCFEAEYCEITSFTDLIVSGPILDRTLVEVEDFYTYNVTSYTMNAVRVYKADTDLVFGQVIVFRSPENSASCGLDLTVGVEYVVGMHIGVDDVLSAFLCGPTRKLATLSDEQLEVLENGGECPDPCAFQLCTGYERCVVNDDGEAECVPLLAVDDDFTVLSYAFDNDVTAVIGSCDEFECISIEECVINDDGYPECVPIPGIEV